METVLLLAIVSALIIVGFVGLRLLRFKTSKLFRQAQNRVDKINQQAKVLIPQTADYPGSLGKDGALLIHEINSSLGRLNDVISEVAEFGFDEYSNEAIQSFDFQQNLLKCEKMLKSLAKMLAQASKKASSINLPKAHKNKSTIESLEEVGLVDKEDYFEKR